jgi:hypothetical protein
MEELAGDAAIESPWQIEPDQLAYALTVKNSANALRQQFGGGMTSARLVRDYAALLLSRMSYWQALERPAAPSLTDEDDEALLILN